MSILRDWLAPPRPDEPNTVRDPAERRALTFEVLVVFAVTLGFSAVNSLLSLLDSLLKPQALADQNVGLNDSQAQLGLIDLALQVTQALRLVAWGALGVFLLWRGGIALWRVGLDRTRPWRDLLSGVGLAALIGIPGLGLYLTAHALGFALTVQPSTLDEAWWRGPVLILSAFGNSFAEEVLMIGYLLTRLRQLGWSENASLWVAAVIRGSYHLYQGIGGFVGNIVMGLVYGRIWQRTNRLWPLIIGHALIDVVAFVGYALLRDQVSWLP